MNSPRFKILFLISGLGCGGAERVSVNLANYWAAKGWEITIVTLAPQSMDFYELHPAVNRISLELTGESVNVLTGLWQNLRRTIALRRVLHKIQPDIALGMTTTANVLVALSAWGLPTCTIGTEHIHPPQLPMSFSWKTLRRYTYSLLSVVTALASESESWIKVNTTAKRVVVIPNAVTWPLIDREPRINPSRSLFQSERKLLLAAGRLESQKGFDWLIEVFSNLAQKHPNWDLAILGDGSLRITLERQIRELDLDNRIFLPGAVCNIGEWYDSADLFVLSSRFEGFGMTLAEAMAHGVAAVSFDCDAGPRDIIRHEVDGLLVPLGDVSELARALDRLMGNDLLRHSFAEKATDAKERFSMERISGMWEKLLEQILVEVDR